MSDLGDLAARPSSEDEWASLGREIGRVVGDAAGPTLIAVAGVHGNERAGVSAARRVLATLEARRDQVRGEFVALSGNLGAMRLGIRYRLRDLNRVWNAAKLSDLRARQAAGEPLDEEEREQLELDEAIRAAIARARGPVHLIDLHTTSAPGLPFILFGDTLGQRRFAGSIPLPLLLGLEEHLDGVLSAYWTAQGCTTCGVEGGQHDDPAAVDNLAAVLVLGGDAAGVLGPGLGGETAKAFALLDRRRGELPRVMEVISRHSIDETDGFVMEPGFANLARARAGQLLARDRNGEIRAPKDGLVILPLYQGQGADGFFWGRELGPIRARVSEALRKMRLERFLHWLPGVRRDPASPSRLVLHERTRHVYRLEVFHLLGYRRIRKSGVHVTVERVFERESEVSDVRRRT